MKTLSLYHNLPLGTISPNLYGHFSEHIGGVFYDGLWVGEDSTIPNIHGFRKDLVEKLRAINPPVLRWPGGCFAETYDWRDGIGPRDQRPTRINWWQSHDHRPESNAVGTHEFVELCRLIGAEPYFAANLTSTTPQDIRDWMDYCNSPRGSTTLARLREQNGSPEPFNVKYWGVGNENWGGGGNMTAETYAHEFRKYAMVMHNVDPHATLIACGPNAGDWRWTENFLRVYDSSARLMRGYSMHYYCGASGSCLDFTEEQFYQLLHQARQMERILTQHYALIQGFGCEAQGKLYIDEWGCWHPDGSGPSKGYNLFEQQSTIRDALVAAMTLNIFNNHCDKIAMANVAQLVNNLHCLFLAGGDQCIVTPTYHVFDMFKGHQGATAIRTSLDNPDIPFHSPRENRELTLPQFSVSASRNGQTALVTIANHSASADETIALDFCGFPSAFTTTEVVTLTADDIHAHNTFDRPDAVAPVSSVQPIDAIRVPRASVVAVTCR